jgi:predicted amidohydrolase
MKVAAGQISAGIDKARNLATLESQLRLAAANGAELIVFPEFSMYRQPVRDEASLRAAEPLDGPFRQRLCALAREHRIAIIAGMTETTSEEDSRYYNTLIVIDSRGDLLGTYRKLHLYDSFGGSESRWTRPGPKGQIPVFEIGGLKLGLMTCYDLRFPEQARALMDAGAEVIVLPTAWTPGPKKDDHWNVMTRARAIENTAYFIGADQAPPHCPGGSRIIDPMGALLAEAGEGEDVIYADLRPERVAHVRRTNPTLQHRRFKVREV